MPNWLVSDIAITAGVGLFLIAWIALLGKRIQDLSDQQEERWQRHIKYEEMVAKTYKEPSERKDGLT